MSAKLYVGNLPWSCNAQTLRELFSTVGTVVNVDIPQDRQGRSRGWGLVDFGSPAEADAAVASLQGYTLDGRALIVRPDKAVGGEAPPRSNGGHAHASAGEGPPANPCRLYVGGLPADVTHDELVSLASLAGAVTTVEVAPQVPGRSRGWGLVDFASAQDAASALAHLNTATLRDRAVIARYERASGGGAGAGAGPKAPRARAPRNAEAGLGNGGGERPPRAPRTRARRPPRAEGESRPPGSGAGGAPYLPGTAPENCSGLQIVVRNLPWTVTSDDLRRVFEQVGAVTAAESVCHADTGRSKGWGTVRFASAEQAQDAIQRFNGIALSERPMQIKLDRFA